MGKSIINMPAMGESVHEVVVVEWLKAIGEEVEEDEDILQVSTDKVDTDIASEFKGKVLEYFVQPNETVAVGKPLVRIETEDGQTVSENPNSSTTAPFRNTTHTEKSNVPLNRNSENKPFFSPLVRSIAQKENISLEELKQIKGTGAEQRVTKVDILNYVSQKNTKPKPTSQPILPPVIHGKPTIEPMDRIRRETSRRMVESRDTAVHVTSFIEADASALVAWREKYKQAFFDKFGAKLTYTPVFLYIIARLLKKFPLLNASIEGENIIVKKSIHTGFAVALPSNNLIVPVVKNADRLTLTQIAIEVQNLVGKAKNNQLTQEEVSGGTYTLSNLGAFGNVMGTPIILQPQVAILAVGRIQKKPVVIETELGDTIGIRSNLFLSHSFDHRLIDGMMGGSFIQEVAQVLNQFNASLEL